MPRKELKAEPIVKVHMKIKRADGSVEERVVDGRIEHKPEGKGNG